MTTVGYISDTEDIIKASLSNFRHDGAAASTLSERSLVPPALSAKDLPGGRTALLNVRQIIPVDHHPAKSDEHSAPESSWGTPKIGLTGIGTWIIQMTAKTTCRLTMNPR